MNTLVKSPPTSPLRPLRDTGDNRSVLNRATHLRRGTVTANVFLRQLHGFDVPIISWIALISDSS